MFLYLQYVFYLVTLEFVTSFEVPFTFLVPWGLGRLSYVPGQPDWKPLLLSSLKGNQGTPDTNNLNAAPYKLLLHVSLPWTQHTLGTSKPGRVV